MNNQFSSVTRKKQLETMEDRQYDLLVIGGGITGAGIALDAALRGIKVAVVEMQDFASGTSSRSTKLVHGGLRYLKQFQVAMVAEVGKEREIVYENGPHVTTPEWMLLPLHKGGTFGRLTTSLALRVYDFLAGVKKSERRTMLSVEETLRKEPLVKKEGLKGSGYYVEYRTDDARLTIEVLKASVHNGAHIVNYAKAVEFLFENQTVIGSKVIDMISNKEYKVRATKVVNAAGPWVDEIRKKDYSRNNKQLRLTKGVHLVFDQSVFPLRQAIYFDTQDGRMVFAVPRDGKTYIGTTDTVYDQDVANPKMLSEDREYILHAIQYMFPDIKVTKEDVESSWAGVRPLIYEEGKDPSEISRKDEIWEAESGLITIAGGKLTGYRKMAEAVVDLVSGQLQKQNPKMMYKKSKTKSYRISGGKVGGSRGLKPFIAKKEREAVRYGFTIEEGHHLAHMYGSNVDELFKYGRQYDTRKLKLSRIVYAQLEYAIEQEMATKPVDFFIRRTGALFFNIEWVHRWKDEVITFMSKKLDWTPQQTQAYKAQLDKELKDAVTPVDIQSL
jgi:glycerol-3-phosphate dehydrogenase